MAYRRSKGKLRKMKKIEPAIHEHVFALPAGESYVDMNQVLSLVNRRFYRQGSVNAIQSIEVQYTPAVPGTPATGICTVQKLPYSWVMSNAWMKGFKAWQRMNNEALEENESTRPRFLDFKIYADSAHHALGFDGNLLPTNLGSTAQAGEWISSKFVIPVGAGAVEGAVNEREIIATGANYPGVSPVSGLDAVCLIEGYANSRALPYQEDPNVPDDMSDASNNTPENWLTAVFNDGTAQDSIVLSDMENENNQAPYPFEGGANPAGGSFIDTQYPGGENQLPGLMIHDRLLITTSTIGGSDTAVGGLFPCGLIKFTTSITGGSAIAIIRTIPGHHRGYLCESMMEM